MRVSNSELGKEIHDVINGEALTFILLTTIANASLSLQQNNVHISDTCVSRFFELF